MKIITEPKIMQEQALAASRAGKRIAFVPTMGYLHEGHLSLLKEGRQRGDLLVLSIFVNPTQFGANEDLSTYPRSLERDCELALSAQTDLVFAPQSAAIYPPDASTWVQVEGLTATLCGASRPHHFRGVTTVVTKLFNLVQPDVALFGMKDFQQLAVIKRMVRDLDMPVEIVGLPIVREDDGLAMSSRNVYLTPAERQQALILSRGLATARRIAATGERAAATVLEVVRSLISGMPDARIDYLQICHQETLQEQEEIDPDSVLLLAVFIGRTRLIDNSFLL